MGLWRGGSHCHNFVGFFSFHWNGFYCGFKMFHYIKARYKIYIWFFWGFFLHLQFKITLLGGGEIVVGCWDPSHPSHPSTPRRCFLDSNHRSLAASCGRGSSKQQHLALWQAEEAAAPVALELPLGLSRGEAADGLSGLLCPCLNYVFFRYTPLRVRKSLYQTPLLVVSTCSCSSMHCVMVKQVLFPCARTQSAL